MTSKIVSIEKYQDRFAVDLDDVLEDIGYARKCAAVRALKENFRQGVDFESFRDSEKKNGRPKEKVFLSPDCFEALRNQYRHYAREASFPCVYLIHADTTELFKIGVSGNVDQRLRGMKTDCPFEVVLVSILYSKDAYSVESEIHESLKQFSFRGEWFKFSESRLNDVIKKFFDGKTAIKSRPALLNVGQSTYKIKCRDRIDAVQASLF